MPRRDWRCKCGTVRLRWERDKVMACGGYMQGQPTTHIACPSCDDRVRIMPDVVWQTRQQMTRVRLPR